MDRLHRRDHAELREAPDVLVASATGQCSMRWRSPAPRPSALRLLEDVEQEAVGGVADRVDGRGDPGGGARGGCGRGYPRASGRRCHSCPARPRMVRASAPCASRPRHRQRSSGAPGAATRRHSRCGCRARSRGRAHRRGCSEQSAASSPASRAGAGARRRPRGFSIEPTLVRPRRFASAIPARSAASTRSRRRHRASPRAARRIAPSIKMPVGSPSASRWITPSTGSGVSRVIPTSFERPAVDPERVVILRRERDRVVRDQADRCRASSASGYRAGSCSSSRRR